MKHRKLGFELKNPAHYQAVSRRGAKNTAAIAREKALQRAKERLKTRLMAVERSINTAANKGRDEACVSIVFESDYVRTNLPKILAARGFTVVHESGTRDMRGFNLIVSWGSK